MTPTEAIIAAAQATTDVTDSLGRTLTVRRPTALDRLRLFKAAGPRLCANEAYLGLALLAFCVTAIDGIPIPQPGDEQQIEHAVFRLGQEGMNAVASILRQEDKKELAVAEGGN